MELYPHSSVGLHSVDTNFITSLPTYFSFISVRKRPGRGADPHPHLECRGPRKGRAIPLLTPRAFVTYKRAKTYLYGNVFIEMGCEGSYELVQFIRPSDEITGWISEKMGLDFRKYRDISLSSQRPDLLWSKPSLLSNGY